MPNITAPFTARPTIYRGIEMRSRLEAKWAAYWDDEREELRKDGHEFSWRYEPFCFGSGAVQYLPDFELVWADAGIPAYAEVKPYLSDPVPLMQKMEIIWDSNPCAELRIDIGNPEDEKPGFYCQRFHPFAWYEWVESHESGTVRYVPEPQWFVEFKNDPLAMQAYEAMDWQTIHVLESLYWQERQR